MRISRRKLCSLVPLAFVPGGSPVLSAVEGRVPNTVEGLVPSTVEGPTRAIPDARTTTLTEVAELFEA